MIDNIYVIYLFASLLLVKNAWASEMIQLMKILMSSH